MKKHLTLKLIDGFIPIDGGVFSYLKRLLKNHNGLSRKFKKKLIDEILENQFKIKNY